MSPVLNCITLVAFGLCLLGMTTSDLVEMTDIIDNEARETDTVLDPRDFADAETSTDSDLSHLGITVRTDPISPGKLEGDIAGIDDVQQYIERSNQRGRNAIKSRWRRWPRGEIPYVLSSRYGRYSRKTIARAMEEYRKKTCVRFVPRDSSKHRDYVLIYPDDGCYSLVGRTGGRQPVSLDAGCIQTGTVIHELMHTVGFFHEQSRNDRDDWIEIDWKNVLSGAKDQFDKYSLRTITHLDEEYDYNSIMHYGPYAFTRNGRKTILPKKSGGSRMGQRDGFSRTDLAKINKLYHCDMKKKGGESSSEDTREPDTVTFPTIPRPSGKCEDNNWRCFFWSLGVIDYCKKYEKVRNEICPKSCGTCTESDKQKPVGASTTTSTTTSTAPTTTTTPRASSEPPRRPGVDAEAKCKDKNPHCPRWSKSKLCSKSGYSTFMAKYCAKSCGSCESATKDAPTTESDEAECRDNPGYKMQCHFIKQLGGCRSRRNRRITQKHCRKSCQLCSE